MTWMIITACMSTVDVVKMWICTRVGCGLLLLCADGAAHSLRGRREVVCVMIKCDCPVTVPKNTGDRNDPPLMFEFHRVSKCNDKNECLLVDVRD